MIMWLSPACNVYSSLTNTHMIDYLSQLFWALLLEFIVYLVNVNLKMLCLSLLLLKDKFCGRTKTGNFCFECLFCIRWRNQKANLRNSAYSSVFVGKVLGLVYDHTLLQ